MIVLTKIDREQNMARFYALDVQPTLFGEFVLVKEWGRIGRGGQKRSAYFASEAEAEEAFNFAFKQRQRRGYKCCE